MEKEQGGMISFKCLLQTQGTNAARRAPPPPPVQSRSGAMAAQLLCNHQAAEAQRNCSCSSNMGGAMKEVADGAHASKPVFHCSRLSLGSGTACLLAG